MYDQPSIFLSTTKWLCIGLFCLPIVACISPEMQVPTVAPTQKIAVQTPVEEQASIALARVVVGVRRGTTIAHFPRQLISIGPRLCNYGNLSSKTLDWGSGTRELGDWQSELGEIFFDVLKGQGLNVFGDSRNLFTQVQRARSAEFLLGARISKIRGNICEWFDGWTGAREGLFSAEFYIEVDWSVFSTLENRTIAQFSTNGRYKHEQPKRHGISLAFSGAFSQATENLLAEPEFLRVLEKRSTSSAQTNGRAPARRNKSQEQLVVPKVPPSERPIRENVPKILNAVVTVRVGGGHGSGFLISESGLILTNQHVVGSAENVGVAFTNGLEVTGKVIRRDAKVDVALVQLPIRTPNVLSLQQTLPRALDDVFAVGSPHIEELRASFTKGVVSAIRIDRATGIRDIQADVPISGGNSGGPLLDRFGNVVGITVTHVVHERAQNLNFFIPISDALDALGIEVESPRPSAAG